MCSIHQKVRSIQSLESDEAGGMRCKPGETCKQTGEPNTSGGKGSWPWMMDQRCWDMYMGRRPHQKVR